MNIPNWPLTVETYALDYETTYKKGVRDIATLGTAKYLAHPETKIYLVSIYGRRADGSLLTYSGPVETAPWREIDGKHWVSHNAAFDASVFMETKRRGQMPGAEDVAPIEWDCTANLAAFLGSGRSLAAAGLSLLGVTVDKTVRDDMNGKTWETMTPEFREASIAYALKDAELCWLIWNGFGARWPVQEVFASRHTMLMVMNGVAVDLPYVESGIHTLKGALWEAEQKIPWVHELDAKGKPYAVGSKKQLAVACIAAGIPPPTSTADKNDAFDKWIAQYEEQAPFVRAVKDHRSINRTVDVLEKFRDRRFDDGRMPYDLKYFGAHTGRWSGGSGLNVQNLTKKKVAGVDVRGCIYPAPGKKFIVADLAQIEARVALWYGEDWPQLELIRGGLDVYEVYARRKLGYAREESLKAYVERLKVESPDHPDCKLRDYSKAPSLGLQFGMGHVRLIDFFRDMLRINLTVSKAKEIVNGYRMSNPGVVKIWNALQNAMENHAVHCAQSKTSEPFRIELPSWRSMEYFDVSIADGLQARDEMGGRPTRWFGGKLFENLVSGTARDVLVEAIYRIEQVLPGSVVLHVHDEVVCEVDMDVPESIIEQCMTVTPEWAPGLPVGSSVETADRYFK